MADGQVQEGMKGADVSYKSKLISVQNLSSLCPRCRKILNLVVVSYIYIYLMFKFRSPFFSYSS